MVYLLGCNSTANQEASKFIYIHIYIYVIYNIYINICVCKETYYKQLAHMIMEAEKSQDLQVAIWKPRRADGIVPVHPKT
jgi:hypothetical protein